MDILRVMAPDSRKGPETQYRTVQLPEEWNWRATLSPESPEAPDRYRW